MVGLAITNSGGGLLALSCGLAIRETCNKPALLSGKVFIRSHAGPLSKGSLS